MSDLAPGVGDGLPDDAIEAAAKAIYERWQPRHAHYSGVPWGDLNEEEREVGRVDAEAALSAALPLIRRHIADQLLALPVIYFQDNDLMALQDEMRNECARVVARGGETADTKETK